MPNNILFIIKGKLDELPESERKIAKVILDNPTAVIQMNASLLAEKAQSSAAAVIRFCRSIGLKGFTDLKLQLSADSQGIQENLYTEILPGEPLDQIKKKLLLKSNHAFKETNQLLLPEHVAAVTQQIHQSSVIYVYGLGASDIVASDFQQKFTRVGKVVICSQDQHLLVTSMSVGDKDSLFLGISNSGEKREVISLMKTAKKLGFQTISLTQNTNNTLNNLANIGLKVANSNEAPLRSGAVVSLLAQLYAVDILFYDYVTKHYEQTVGNLEKSRDAVSIFTDFDAD